MVDHMVVGDRVTVGRNEEAGTEASDHLVAMHLALLAVPAISPEEFFKRRTLHEGRIVLTFLILRLGPVLLIALVDSHPHRDHRGFDLRDEVGKAGRALRICGYRRRRRGEGTPGEPAVSERSAGHKCGAEHGRGAKKREPPRRPNFAARLFVDVCHDCISKR